MKFTIQSLLTLAFATIFFVGCQEEDLQPRSELNQDILTRAATGAVYSMDNNADVNNLLVFERSVTGELTTPEVYPTGGSGNGGGLGSQGSLIQYGEFVILCNAGSNEISVFDIRGNSIELVDVVGSEGIMPTSVTAFDGIIYVLNAGGVGTIAGFTLSDDGELDHIEGSARGLSAPGAAPAQISFNKNGNTLVVTERATNLITTYHVNPDGVAEEANSYPSAGVTPFGFSFVKNDVLILSEASGGAAGASTASSYHVASDGSVTLAEGPVSTGQSAACWIEVTGNGKYAYATNTASNNITGFSVNSSGSLALLNLDGITAESGAGPIDASTSRNSKYLYVLNGGDDSITIYAIDSQGGLDQIGEVTGLPASIAGLAAE